MGANVLPCAKAVGKEFEGAAVVGVDIVGAEVVGLTVVGVFVGRFVSGEVVDVNVAIGVKVKGTSAGALGRATIIALVSRPFISPPMAPTFPMPMANEPSVILSPPLSLPFSSREKSV